MKSAFHFFWLLLIVHGSVCVAAPPNIVFFFSDDQAYDTLGCYGNPDAKTPNIDRLAAQGIAFDRHYDTTAICMASRASVMTGLLEYKHGTNFGRAPLRRDIWLKSYPIQLRKAGYLTAFGGKFGFDISGQPESEARQLVGAYKTMPVREFDFWVGGIGQTNYATAKNKYLAKYAAKYPHSTRAYGAAGQDFIRQAKAAGKPFCLSLFFKAPHRPTTPDPMFDDIYEDVTFRKLPNYGRAAGAHLAPQSRLGRQYPRFVEWGYNTEKTYQKALRIYNQLIYGVDYAVGMVMRELEDQGLADNTIIIFSSDNGYFNGSHGLGSKVLHYEEGSRVPLVIVDPRAPKSLRNTRNASVTGNIDITATILDAAGVALPANMDGVSLLPIVRGKVASVRDSLPLVQAWGPRATFSLGVATKRYKFLYWPYGEGMPPCEELFDAVKDPYELKNFIDDPEYADVLAELRAKFDAEVAKFKSNDVAPAYRPLSTFYDRTIPWPAKRSTENASKVEKRVIKKRKRKELDSATSR